MAFVYRASRNSPIKTDTADVGPGLYISPDYKPNEKKVSPNKVPFHSSAARDFKSKKEDSSVGPGYYYKDDRHENFLKMISKDVEKKKSPLYKSIDVEKQTPFGFYLAEDLRQKYGFLSKDKRFKNQSFDGESPGPGSYTLDNKFIKKSPATSRVKPLKNSVDEHISELVGSEKRITSIPDKKHSFGYEIRGDNIIKMNNNPEYNKILSGNKNDSAGPGQYDVISPDNWVKGKKGTQWSKYKSGRSQTLNSVKTTAANSNAEDFEFSNEKKVNQELALEKRKLEKLKLHKLFKEQGRRRRSLVNEFHGSPNSSLLDKLTKEDQPGPGYYIDIYEHSCFKRDSIPEKLQKFGSGSQRFIPDHVTIEGSIGPGAYFVDDIYSKKFKQMSDRVNKSPPFGSSQKRDGIIMENSSPGPGAYESLKKIDNKVASTKCIFGSSEIRLPERNKELQPGPGSYIPLEKWNKISTNDILKMMKPKFQENVKIVEQKDKIEEGPPIGAYNADLVESLAYKVEKKNSKFNSVNAPFGSVNKRFRYKTSNNKIGPGSYEKDEKYIKIQDKEFHPPFLQSDRRFKTLQEGSTLNGPGLYNQESYFNWNKKSYNILYYN